MHGWLAKTGWIHRIPGKGSFVLARELVQIEKPVTYEQEVAGLVSPSEIQHKRIGLVIPKIEDFFSLFVY